MTPQRTIGETIKQAREARGMSQEDVSRETRLSLVVIRALELDRFGEMPGELYIANAIRMIAECLELDRADLMARYRDGAGALLSGEDGAERETGGVWTEEGVPETRVAGWRPGARFWTILVAVLMIGALAWAFATGRIGLPSFGGGRDEAPLATPDSTATSTEAAGDLSERIVEETMQVVQEEPPPATGPDPDPEPEAPLWTDGPLLPDNHPRATTLRREAALVLRIGSDAPCRVQLNVDGHRHLARALDAGRHWRVSAAEFVVLSASDGSALNLTVDDEPYPLPADLPAGKALALRVEVADSGEDS